MAKPLDWEKAKAGRAGPTDVIGREWRLGGSHAIASDDAPRQPQHDESRWLYGLESHLFSKLWAAKKAAPASPLYDPEAEQTLLKRTDVKRLRNRYRSAVVRMLEKVRRKNANRS
jgi:hypothetical protein